jgi:uncharacterized protein
VKELQPLELTRTERWILANQFRILELLDSESADHYANAREVLESGFELSYERYAQRINANTMNQAEGQEVLQILDMFSALERCYKDPPEKPDVEERQVRFSGFDGNNEIAQLGYAGFVIEREGRFRELADHGDHLNSHAPLLGAYRRMLAVWEQLPLERRFELTAKDIEAICAAKVHPSNR